MEEQGVGAMEFGENDVYIAMEEGDLDGEELDDLDDADPVVVEEEEDLSAQPDGDTAMEPPDDHALLQSKEHQAEVVCIACHPSDPAVLASGGCDDRAVLWNMTTNATTPLAAHKDTVSHIGFNTTGSLVATAGVDGSVCIWQTSDGSALQALEGPDEEVTWVAWHPRGDLLLAGSTDMRCWLWNATSGACMHVFSGHSGAVTCGCFTADGRLVVTGSADGSLRVWSGKTAECTATVSGHPFHEAGLTCCAVQADGVALSGGEDGSLRLSNLTNGRVLGTLEGHTDSVEAVAFADSLPGTAVSCSLDGALIVWDLRTMAVRLTCSHPAQVVGLAVHPTTPAVATACLDGGVRVWDMRSGLCVRHWTGHVAGVQCVSFTCDGRHVVSGSDDNTMRVFSADQPGLEGQAGPS